MENFRKIKFLILMLIGEGLLEFIESCLEVLKVDFFNERELLFYYLLDIINTQIALLELINDFSLYNFSVRLIIGDRVFLFNIGGFILS